jgi:hypothetical protein
MVTVISGRLSFRDMPTSGMKILMLAVPYSGSIPVQNMSGRPPNTILTTSTTQPTLGKLPSTELLNNHENKTNSCPVRTCISDPFGPL